jgi:hypothetical protein
MLKNMDSRDLMSAVAGMASLLTHGVRVHVADGSTSIIRTADNTVKTFLLNRSSAELVSPDGAYIYFAIVESSEIPEAVGSRSSPPTAQRLL